MNIILTNGFYIEIGNLNYMLRRKSLEQKPDGTPFEADRFIGYYGNLKSAVKGFVEESHNIGDDSVSLEAYVDRVERSNQETAVKIAAYLMEKYPQDE